MSVDPLMDALDRGTCRYCPAEIAWAMTVKDRRLPLDPQAHPDGNIRLERDGGGIIRALVYADTTAALREAEETAEIGDVVGLYRSHFATCPGATEARRRRGGKSGKS